MDSAAKRSMLSTATARFENGIENALKKSNSGSSLSRPKTSKFQEIHNLNKLLPKAIPQEKERLYEENLQLKVNVHELLTENLQQKTRIRFYEDKNKQCESSEPNKRVITQLKHQLKEYKLTVHDKDDEILDLKKNLRVSRLNEFEMEIKVYKDECLRLRQQLKDLLERNGIPKSYLEFENEIHFKDQQIESIKKEYKEKSLDAAKLRDEIAYLKEKAQVSNDIVNKSS